MMNIVKPALVLLALLSGLLGLLYPALVTGLGQTLFPYQANGSIIRSHGGVWGSALIGQSFSSPGFFWGRPSVTTPVPYNGAASAGSNLGPTNPVLREAVLSRLARLRAADPGDTTPVPVDLVTASGSGLDPHISPAAAYYQVSRIARIRGLSVTAVSALVERNVEGRSLGLFGEPRVNVLRLNLALEDLVGAGLPPER
ncbi:MAG: potassium-transporting ATPase subunit KdpC [Candidatus Eisenbacteria bacterium]